MEKTEEMQGSNARWGPDCILGQGQDGTVGQLLTCGILECAYIGCSWEQWLGNCGDLPYCGTSCWGVDWCRVLPSHAQGHVFSPQHHTHAVV